MAELFEKSKRDYLDYLFEQYKKGLLDDASLTPLIEAGYITSKLPTQKGNIVENRIESEERQQEEFQSLIRKDFFTANYEKYSEYSNNIKREDWIPKSVISHSDDFYEWINNITFGYFTDAIERHEYKKYELYKAQCFKWLAEDSSPTNHADEERKIQCIKKEYQRCRDNTMYFAIKYCFVKEGDDSSGKIRYKPKEVNSFLFYLLDCGYSLFIGKPRQIYSSTTMGIYALKKILFQKNYFIKFVAEDDKTVQEIFRDKIKYPFAELNVWMTPKVLSDSAENFWLGQKVTKGEIKGQNSRIAVVPPTITAINGGSPQLVFIDEIGSINILTEMIAEGLPTMFMDKYNDGNLEMKRQLVAWGCVCAGTNVWNSNGELVNIEDLKQDDGIIGYNGSSVSKELITYMQEPKEKPCYRIITHTGRTLDCSEDHPILSGKNGLWNVLEMGVKNGKRIRKFFKKTKFVETKDLKIGDHIAVIEEVPIWGNKLMWNPRVVGWLIGDGTYGKEHGVRISSCDTEITECIENNFDSTVKLQRSTKDGRIYKEIYIRNVSKELYNLGIGGQTKQNKRLPVNSHSYVRQHICEMLGGFFDTDGCVHYTKEYFYIDLTCAVLPLLIDVQYLLQKLGIHSRISRVKCNPLTNSKDKNDWFVLVVKDVKSIRAFYNNIKFAIKYKQERLEIVIEKIKTKKSQVPKGSNGLRFEKLKSLEYIGLRPVYNLTAENTNTYIANGIVTHNTGVGSVKGKGAYQREWYRILGLWEEKNRQVGFVPIFLSWHTRCNAKHYKEQKAVYYGGKNLETGIDLETNKKMFHQHYPSSFKDMFILSGNTLVGKELIDEGLSRIRKIDHSQRPVAGYFEPVFDYTKPESENSDVPFKIIDANFIPCNDDEMDRATAWRLLPPDRSWINRYYSGVDPISVETGHSMFSTTIWDKSNHAPVCILNFRKQHDHKYCFLQSLLMEIYYDTNRAQNNKEGCPDLIEANIGQNYYDYCERAGYIKHFVYTSELPERLRGGARKIGVDNKGMRSLYIIDKMRECVKTYYKNFYFEVIFKQLDTFVQKTTSKSETWEALDKIAYFDDVLFSLTFAYINAEYVHDHKVPKCVEETERQISKIKHPKKRKADGSLTRRPEKKLIKTSIW